MKEPQAVDAMLDCTAPRRPPESPAWSRRGIAEKVVEYEARKSPWTSRRRIAGELGVPARTLHHWIRRKRTLVANSLWPKAVTLLMETPAGIDFLHRLVTAAQLVFVQANDCGP